MNQAQAEELMDMFADGKLIDSINTSLALHLVDLARELGRDALVGRLLDHAAKVSENPEDQGWCQFELLKHQGASKDELIGLGVQSEKDGLPALAAAPARVRAAFDGVNRCGGAAPLAVRDRTTVRVERGG